MAVVGPHVACVVSTTYFGRRSFCFFFSKDTATTQLYTLSLHDALPIYPRHHLAELLLRRPVRRKARLRPRVDVPDHADRSEEHTSELQSLRHLVCRLLLEKKNQTGSQSTSLHSQQVSAARTRTGSS